MSSLIVPQHSGKQGKQNSYNAKNQNKNNQQQSKKESSNYAANYTNSRQSTYYKHTNSLNLAKQQTKPTTYGKVKNVGSSKVFYRDYDYQESIYVAKPNAKHDHKLSPEKTSRNLSGCSTLASEEELASSWLYGFKIVHDGRTLHNEVQSDVEELRLKNSLEEVKFAGSVYNIGPSCKEIPMPSFIDEDDV